MKILLDECLPRKLKDELGGHQVTTVPEAGLAGVKNGALLRQAEENFDVFLTIDGSLGYQQNLADVKMALVVMVAHDNSFETLRPLMPRVLDVLRKVRMGNLVEVE